MEAATPRRPAGRPARSRTALSSTSSGTVTPVVTREEPVAAPVTRLESLGIFVGFGVALHAARLPRRRRPPRRQLRRPRPAHQGVHGLVQRPAEAGGDRLLAAADRDAGPDPLRGRQGPRHLRAGAAALLGALRRRCAGLHRPDVRDGRHAARAPAADRPADRRQPDVRLLRDERDRRRGRPDVRRVRALLPARLGTERLAALPDRWRARLRARCPDPLRVHLLGDLHRLPDLVHAELARARRGRGRGLGDRLPGADHLRARDLDLLQRDRSRRSVRVDLAGRRLRPRQRRSAATPRLRPHRRRSATSCESSSSSRSPWSPCRCCSSPPATRSATGSRR